MNRKALCGAMLAVPLILSSTVAQAATVQYLDVNDAVASFFDAAKTVPDVGNPDKLIVGLVNFEASAPGETGVLDVAFDTISFTIQAEPDTSSRRSRTSKKGTTTTVRALSPTRRVAGW